MVCVCVYVRAFVHERVVTQNEITAMVEQDTKQAAMYKEGMAHV